MILDHIGNSRHYTQIPWLRQGLAWLLSPESAHWKDGRIELPDSGIFAMPQTIMTKELHQGRWEAHRRYIDIQYLVSGIERIGYTPVANLALTTPYDEDKDVAFYQGHGDILTLEPGMFAVFFPHDAHMPMLCEAGGSPKQVRKIVVKIPVE